MIPRRIVQASIARASQPRCRQQTYHRLFITAAVVLDAQMRAAGLYNS